MRTLWPPPPACARHRPSIRLFTCPAGFPLFEDITLQPRLTHVTFPVQNIDESVRFYHEWFGLVVHLDRRPQGNTLWLATAEQDAKPEPDFVFVIHEAEVSKIDHFGFQVASRDELDEIAERAKKAGIWVEGPVDLGGKVGSFVFVRDPNGHIWEYTFGQDLLGL